MELKRVAFCSTSFSPIGEGLQLLYGVRVKLYGLPTVVRGLIFDIDNTLYHHAGYTKDQIDLLIARLARERGVSHESMNRDVERYRNEHAAADGGRRPSLGNTFVDFGVPIEQSVRWREEELHPERYLRVDTQLDDLLQELGRRYRLACVTNNPTLVGRKTLSALGVESRFSAVIGLDRSKVSKPHSTPFRLAAEAIDCPIESLVSIGDRFEIDLEPALQLGMGAILIEGRADLFELPAHLKGRDVIWT